MHQLRLFDHMPLPDTPDPLQLLRDGAALALSVSGGKDSDAMSHHLLDMRRREGWTGTVCLIHADLGRAEWHTTPAYIEGFARRKGVDLHVVRWTHGDLIDRIWARWEALNHAACPWPSAAARYCTSDLKRALISRWIRQQFPTGSVICGIGLRAGESTARARRVTFTPRSDCTAPTLHRQVWDWLPVHDWNETQVWDCIHQHANIAHPAYALGNRRLSCACCVLASLNDLINGAIHNPDTYRELCRIEAVTGYSFRQNLWLSDLQPHLLPHETLSAVRRHQATRI